MAMPSNTAVYGSDLMTLYPEEAGISYTYTYKIRITQDEIYTIDQDFQKCHLPYDNISSVSQCIVGYMENQG